MLLAPAAASVQSLFDSLEQGVQAERHVDDTAVHEEARRAAYAAALAALEMLEHALPIDLVVELRGEEGHVEPELIGVTQEMLAVEVSLMLEQLRVHLPELALRPRALGGLGGGERMRMHVDEREVTIREAHLLLEAVQDYLDGRGGLLAVRALEVAVLDEDDGRVLGTEQVIGVIDGFGEIDTVLAVGHCMVSSSTPCGAFHTLTVLSARDAMRTLGERMSVSSTGCIAFYQEQGGRIHRLSSGPKVWHFVSMCPKCRWNIGFRGRRAAHCAGTS